MNVYCYRHEISEVTQVAAVQLWRSTEAKQPWTVWGRGGGPPDAEGEFPVGPQAATTTQALSHVADVGLFSWAAETMQPRPPPGSG